MAFFAVAVLFVLGATKIVWKLPKPLLIVSGAFFLAWVIVFWFLGGHRRWSATGMIARTFVTWLAVTSSFLFWVYHWDRAGWIWSTISGYNHTMSEDYPDAVNLDVNEFVRQHPAFKSDASSPSGLILPAGEYHFDRTTVLPRDVSLTIAPGATLRFGVGCSLISYGAIIACGTEDRPIVFAAHNKWRKWGVVGIAGDDSSVFDHTIFENGRQAVVNGVEFTGCLSVIDGRVAITNSRFLNLFGRDAVNVRRSRVLIRDNFFKDTYNDGLDLDGGAGEVSRNRFVNCAEEGIDLSENENLSVYDNQIFDSRGGRLAAEKNVEQIRRQNTLGHLEI
jgi:hypothetical protein